MKEYFQLIDFIPFFNKIKSSQVKTSDYFLKLRLKPALLRQATYGTIKLGFYQYLKKIFIQNPQGLLE